MPTCSKLAISTINRFGGNVSSFINALKCCLMIVLMLSASAATAQTGTGPTITSVTAGSIGYNAHFQVNTPDASTIASVVLMRPAGVTHAFNMEERLVGLSFTVDTGGLNVVSPPNGKIAPPGYYMLFILNSSDVPSVGAFVQICNGTCA